MRFLYGDSVPFPLGYNFLATLEAFMAAATKVVELEMGAQKLIADAQEGAISRQRGLEALESFHTIVMRVVQETAAKVQHPIAGEYARQVGESAARVVDEHRANARGASDREQGTIQSEGARRKQEVHTLVEQFLKVARLPVQGHNVAIELTADGKGYEASCIFTSSHGIVTAFTLSVDGSASWSRPRKVSDLQQNMDLMVGVKKSWLKGTVTPEKVKLDEWFVGSVDVTEDRAEIALRRKPNEKDSLVFKMTKTEQGTYAQVEHPGDPNAEALPAQMAPEDLPMLERFANALRVSSRELLEQRLRLLAAQLDGTDVLEAGTAIPLVERVVAMFAPTVTEIAKRSPNAFELSLKTENEGGRREEIYLKKEELVSRLAPLSAAGRAVFAPLGLDAWVPAVTVRPPEVAPK